MMDADVVAASPATVYRVLQRPAASPAGIAAKARKAKDFSSLSAPRALAHGHQLRQRLRHVLLPHQRARWLQPHSSSTGNCASRCAKPISRSSCSGRGKNSPTPPRIITDNGPQFIANDFKEFIRLCGHDPRPNQPLLSAEQRQRSNAGTAHSSASAFGRTCRCRWRRRGGWWKASWSITTTSACTARSATSRRPTSWPAVKRRSSPRATASWKRPVNEDAKPGGLHLPVMMGYNTKRPGRRIGQRRGATRAPTQGPRSKDGRCAPRAVLLPFRSWHQSDKPDWHDATDTTAGCLLTR